MPELHTPPSSHRRGAPRGNRNAVKHGFYSRSLPSSDKKDLEAYSFAGLQEQITTLRLLYRQAVTQAFRDTDDPIAFQEDARVCVGFIAALNATLRTQIELELHGGSEMDKTFAAALAQVAEEFGLIAPGENPPSLSLG